MQRLTELSRGQWALRVAQQCAADNVFSEVTSRLRSEPCVAFALFCGGFVDWSHETEVAVRMLSLATYGFSVDDGHLIWGLKPTHVTPATIESGLRAVTECVSILKNLHQPFEFLAHVEGQTSIGVHYRCDDGNSPLSQLADELANEVGSLCG